jgi:hypothetical protein
MIKNRVNPTLYTHPFVDHTKSFHFRIQMKPRLKKLRLYPLDTIDANASRKDNLKHPLFLTHVELSSSLIVLNPSIDEVQQLMHQLVNYVLNIFHGVRKWGEVRDIDMKFIHDYPMRDFSELLTANGNLEIDKNGEEISKEMQQQGKENDE